MDRHEKKRLRDYIGEHLDVSGTRLTDDEATFLGNFLDEYDKTHRGRVVKNSRAVATRYDKRAYLLHGTVTAAAKRLWLCQ